MNCSASIIYSNSWLAQTASISEVTVFTATSDCQIRATAGAYISGSAPAGLVATQWTISYPGTSNPQNAVLEDAATTSAGQVMSFPLRTGDTVGFAVTLIVDSPATLTSFDAYLTLEQLQ